jgi:predicted DNA-binding transcriptional regulator AlpA
MEHELLTLDEYADLMRTTASSVRHWRRTNYGPQARRIGRRLVWLKSEVEEYIAQEFANACR